jgi:hypothetical protein
VRVPDPTKALFHCFSFCNIYIFAIYIYIAPGKCFSRSSVNHIHQNEEWGILSDAEQKTLAFPLNILVIVAGGFLSFFF